MIPETEGNPDTSMNAHDAMAVIQHTRQRATNALEVRSPALYLAWGLTIFFAYGVLWWAARDEHPYHEFTKNGLGGVLIVIVIAGAAIRLGLVGRALSGISGGVVRQWSIFSMSLAAGSAALWVEAAALNSAGASRAITGVLVAATPMLCMGLVFMSTAAVRLDWSSFALGFWLLAVGAAATWSGPVTCLAIYALAGGVGFLVLVYVSTQQRRS